VDMTFSVSKSFVSTVGGLALDDGLIRDLDDRVRDYVPGWFDSPHNASITWRHLFTQTSEWEGTLWGKPDAADRRRGRGRTLQPPGTFWEYNDVRVNLAALSLLHVWKRPLPDVLKRRVMDPIDASESWRWHGYRNSWATIDGRRLKSVSGGGHWGGGLWISTRDEARFGYLFLREGRWAGRRVVSRDWVYAARTPTPARPGYGLMWWLNTDGEMWPGLPADNYAALGGGTNAIWVDPGDDLVVVVRWIDGASLGAFLNMVRHSIRVIREAPGP
ncbi:MAG: serine hydrolase domain-containing protein, partial [Gemmatimonadota bacterium]